MAIPSFLSAIAAYQLTVSTVVLIAASAAVLGGVCVGIGIYYLRLFSFNQANLRELKTIRAERSQRSRQLQEEVGQTLKEAQTNTKHIAHTSLQIHHHIASTADTLEEEINITHQANVQLMDITSLLKGLGESSIQKVRSIIEELKRRLESAETTSASFKVIASKLEQTEQLLEESGKCYAISVQELTNTIEHNKTEIQLLTRQLSEANTLLNPDNEAIKVTAKALELAQVENQKLTKKIIELEASGKRLASELNNVMSARGAQSSIITKLLAQNKKLTAEVSQLSAELEEEDNHSSEINYSSRMPGIH